MPLTKMAGAEAGQAAAEAAGLLARNKGAILGLGGLGAATLAGGYLVRSRQRKREERVVNNMLNRGVPKYAEEIDYILERHLEKDAFLQPLIAGAKAIGTGIKAAFSGGGGNMNFFRRGLTGTMRSLHQQGFDNMARGVGRMGNMAARGAKRVNTFFQRNPAAAAAGGSVTG